MSGQALVRSKEEVLALTSTLQNPQETTEARCAACDAVLALSKTDSTCAVIASAGGIHAVINALKSATDCEPLLKGTVLTLRNLYRFDSKLTSIVVRLQEGISAMLEGLREHIHCSDTELLQALLTVLSDVAHNAANVQVLVKENGTAVILASVLAHLKNDQLLLPALNLLVAISRQPNHIPTLVREGGVPAVLAAILAHLRRVEVLRSALIVLRNIVADDTSALRLGGQGAYRIVFAVLQTHSCVEQLDLIRLGAAVLWRIHHARSPPTQLLHSQLAFEAKLDHNGNAVGVSGGAAPSAHASPALVVAPAGGSAAEEEEDENERAAGNGGRRGTRRQPVVDDADSDCCGDDADEAVDLGGGVAAEAVSPALLGGSAQKTGGGAHGSGGAAAAAAAACGGGAPAGGAAPDDTPPPIPQVSLRYGGHCEWLEACPEVPEGLSSSSSPATHAELVVKSITSDAERLMTPSISRGAPQRPPGAELSARGAQAEAPLPSAVAAPPYPRVVFDAHPSEGQHSHSGVMPGSLTLDADFESANLRRAVQVGAREYNLVLSCDVNTRGHTQWFLFRLRGMEPNVPYRFNLINLMKPDSLFSSGMRPLLYSEKHAHHSGVGWYRSGEDIAYYMNQYAYAPAPKKPAQPRKGALPAGSAAAAAAAAGAAAAREQPLSSFYTLTFTLTFPYAADTCYVSQCYPYTYSMATAFTSRLVQQKRSALIRRETLCHSYGGNPVDLLSVTDFSSPAGEVAARKVVVISARVHPGESNASWMMHGLLEAVTADTEQARLLRRTLMLKIVPMLNPDGVILGNYRCSVVGVDLNRQWAEPHEQNMPTIYHLKRLMKSYVASEQLLLFCDLHGHSRKRNIFAYGCENPRGPHRLRERVFPRLLSDCAHFSLGACSFKVLRSKESTGRVVVNRAFATPNSFTLEASFCGADFGAGAGAHYNISHLKEMGAAFVPALVNFTEPSQSRVQQIMAELEAAFPLADNDDNDDNDAADTSTKDAATDVLGEASEKLRRAVRGSRARPPVSSKPNGGGANASSSGATGASARRKSTAEAATKKKKKPASGGSAISGSGGLSPRNTRSPH